MSFTYFYCRTVSQSYCHLFKTIGQVIGPFDTVALPIGAYNPRWFLRTIHINPAEAVKIHQDVKAKQSFGIHWVSSFVCPSSFLERALL